MSNLVVLSPEHHQQFAVETRYLPNLGYDHGSAMISPIEIPAAQRAYPLVFRKHQETGRFFLNALLGFAADENLYLDGKGNWLTDYVPLAVRKGPFLIAMLDADADPQRHQSQAPAKAVLSLDIDDPRVIRDHQTAHQAAHQADHQADAQPSKGQRLFDDSGVASPYLEEINQILATMHETVNYTHQLAEAFVSLGLIEPLSLDILLSNGEQIKLDGAYTVAEEKLLALSGDALAQLNQQGFLSLAYYIAGSIDNVGWLVERKNER